MKYKLYRVTATQTMCVVVLCGPNCNATQTVCMGPGSWNVGFREPFWETTTVDYVEMA